MSNDDLAIVMREKPSTRRIIAEALADMDDGSDLLIYPRVRFGKYGNVSSEAVIFENDAASLTFMRRRSYKDGRVTSRNISLRD